MAQALYRSTFLENWGSGIHRIIEACREQDVDDPTWRLDGAFVYVTFKRPAKLDSHSAQVPSKQEEDPLNYRPSTAQVQKLILSMNEGYMTMRELMECVGLKHRTTFRKNYLLPAIEDGAIGLLYPDVPNHPKQRYSLTDKAIMWKREKH